MPSGRRTGIRPRSRSRTVTTPPLGPAPSGWASRLRLPAGVCAAIPTARRDRRCGRRPGPDLGERACADPAPRAALRSIGQLVTVRYLSVALLVRTADAGAVVALLAGAATWHLSASAGGMFGRPAHPAAPA